VLRPALVPPPAPIDAIEIVTKIRNNPALAHKNIGFRNFEEIADSLADIAKVEVAPRSMGRRMTMMVAPLAKSERKAKPAAEEGAKDKPASAGDATPKPAAPPNEPPPTHQSPNV